MSGWRAAVREWMPPALMRALMHARGNTLEFREGFSGWDQARAASSGYDAPVILQRTLEATRRVLCGEAAWCRDGVPFPRPEYFWPLMAALMRVAAANDNCVRVLDFGGSLGCTYLQHRALLRSLRRVEWVVVEQPVVAGCGREHVLVDGLQFHDDIPSALSLGAPDLVLLSSVLQYVGDPRAIMRELRYSGARAMVVDRTPVHDTGDANLIVVQRAPRRVYSATYPCHIFSHAGLRELLAGWEILADFPAAEGRFRLGGRRSFEFRGMLLERSS